MFSAKEGTKQSRTISVSSKRTTPTIHVDGMIHPHSLSGCTLFLQRHLGNHLSPGSFGDKRKILRRGFVECGLSIPSLIGVFQFNPVRLARNRRVSFCVPSTAQAAPTSGQEEGRRGKSLSMLWLGCSDNSAKKKESA